MTVLEEAPRLDLPAGRPQPLGRDRIAAWIDVVATVFAATLAMVVLTDWTPWLRPALALVTLLFVPGWTLLRAFGVPLNELAVAASCTASIATLLLGGQLLVISGGWHWQPAGAALLTVCTLAGGWRAGRNFRSLTLRRTAPSIEWTNVAIVAATSLVGIALVSAGLRASPSQHFGPAGLVGDLAPWYWLGVAVIIIGLVSSAVRRSRGVWVSIGLLVVVLHGLPGMLEPHPRFNVAWLHTGFIDHIADNGTLLVGLDGRFSWAGFFSGGGWLQRLAATDDLLWLVRFAPLFYNGLALLLLVWIGRRSSMTQRQVVVAATLFCLMNWVGQDYLAPQATGFVLYYTIAAVVIWAFPGPGLPAGRLARLIRATPPVPTTLRRSARIWLALGLHVLVLALVVTHQLTPGFLVSALILLVVTGTTSLRWMPFYVTLAFLAWLSYGADAYWVGHFDNLVGSVGQVSDLVSQNVGERARAGIDPERVFVLRSRLVYALLMWSLAAVSILRDRRRGRTPIALAVLLVAPFPMLLIQPYGGEMLLRICFFTALPSALLIARLLVRPDPPERRGVWKPMVGASLLIALVPVFVTTRFGNEGFEAFSDANVAITRSMYDIVPDGANVFVDDRQTIAYSDRVASVRFRFLRGATLDDKLALLDEYAVDGPVYVLLTDSQETHGQLVMGEPADEFDDLVDGLERSGRLRVVERSDHDNVLMEYQGS